MKRLALIAGCLLSVSVSQATYSGFTYQRTVVIDHTKVSTGALTITNFPIEISSMNIVMSTSASGGHMTGAYDQIWSTKSDCSLSLYFDTETVNNTGTSTTTVWVNVPSVSSVTDTTLYWCYGNSGITTYQGVSSATWDSNYMGVWHMGTPTAFSAADSTGKNTGTPYSVSAAGGQISGAGSFDGTNSYVDVGVGSIVPYQGSTMEAWVYATGSLTSERIILDQYGGNHGYNFELNYADLPGEIGGVYQQDASHYIEQFSEPGISGSVWEFAAEVYSATGIQTYFNGAATTLTAQYGPDNMSGNYSPGGISKQIGGRFGSSSARWNGMIDELRLSSIQRSSDWIKTEYNNQSSPYTFTTIGAETTSGGAVTGNAFWFGEF